MVRTFQRRSAVTRNNFLRGGPSNLACGSPKWGYRHLLKHRGEWETAASIAQENWRDLADFAMYAAFTDPDVTTYSQKNNTFCFSRAILLVENRTGRTLGVKIVRVVIGAVTKNVITAYLPDEQCNDRS